MYKLELVKTETQHELLEKEFKNVNSILKEQSEKLEKLEKENYELENQLYQQNDELESSQVNLVLTKKQDYIENQTLNLQL